MFRISVRCIVDADRMKGQIEENYNRIKAEVKQIVADELKCIADDPELATCYNRKSKSNFLYSLKSATLLKSQSVAAQTAKNAIFLVWTDFLPCVG